MHFTSTTYWTFHFETDMKNEEAMLYKFAEMLPHPHISNETGMGLPLQCLCVHVCVCVCV